MPGYRMGCVVVMLGALVAAGGVVRAQSRVRRDARWRSRYTRATGRRLFSDWIRRTRSRSRRSSLTGLPRSSCGIWSESWGRRSRPEDQLGDLTFLLIPMQSTGVHIGPGGEPLATLRIYASLPGTPRGTLLWAETYTGQPDRPWPATVHTLIEQFHDRLQKH